MRSSILFSAIPLLPLCGLLSAQTPPPVQKSAAPSPPTTLAATVIHYGDQDVPRIRTKLRFTTLIMLPRSEQILDFTCGDKEFWIVNGTQNFAYVKPAKANSRTNLNLVTASGNVYSFLLQEIGEQSADDPDLKVFVEPKDESMISALNSAPKWVPAQQIDDYRQQVEIAKDEARQARKTAEEAVQRDVSKFQSEYPTGLKFPYKFEPNRKPFAVSAIYHDDKFTYIQANPQETPALYELKDGTPNLINFQFRNGTYIVDKILDSGYLAIGKQKLAFDRQE